MKNKEQKIIILAAILILCHLTVGKEFLRPTDLTVLDRPADTMMRDYLTAIVDEQFAQRASMLAALKSAEDWDRHAKFVRDSMAEWTGPFPQRTPLRARITGKIHRDRYILEKIVFESRPNFLVSANLYVPTKSPGPHPAILNVIGHSSEGKATEKVQRRAIAQARKGFVAFVIDGIGQGERQVEEYASISKPPGNAHQIIGTQAFIAGTHLFNFMAWDAIRAVDYLSSRPEVDPKRIGCTGCSGGGMMTTYILPFEPRITVAVPACNPNTWSHRVHANLATDHEQVFFGAFVAGIDPRGDPLFAHVPKPLLIDATTDDNLNPPAGVWDLSTWLYKAYAAHGAPQAFQTTMVEGPHGYIKEQREFAYAWMLKWLGGKSEGFWEEEFPVEKKEDTWCTARGNVYNEPGSRKPRELVLDYLRTHRSRPVTVRTQKDLTKHRNRIQSLVKDILFLKAMTETPRADARIPRLVEGLKLTPVIIKSEEGIELPSVWIESPNGPASGPVIIYLNDAGKMKLSEEIVILRTLLNKGFRIFAVDLRGMGETAPDQKEKFWDFLAGRPLFGQRVGDVQAVLKYLSQKEGKNAKILVWAKGMSGVYSAFAATLDQGVTGMVLERPLLSFEEIVTSKVPTYKHEVIVPGIMKTFDLPDIYQALCPIDVVLINPLAGNKLLVSKRKADDAYRQTTGTYTALEKSGHWSVHAKVTTDARADLLVSTFEKMTRN
ncbi:MAG: acetylxylan esterase [Sedimentisphaerales bacterium]|nr:acetylxylan esterase [Sedimentisphaerales bacterium]